MIDLSSKDDGWSGLFDRLGDGPGADLVSLQLFCPPPPMLVCSGTVGPLAACTFVAGL